MKQILIFAITFIFVTEGFAMYKGFNLTEYEGFLYDASDSKKTDAQIAVDRAKELGANHIELNIRAKMIGPFSNEIIPVTPASRNIGDKTSKSHMLLVVVVLVVVVVVSVSIWFGLKVSSGVTTTGRLYSAITDSVPFRFVNACCNGPTTTFAVIFSSLLFSSSF